LLKLTEKNPVVLQRDTLGERFVRTARRNWEKRCICDSLGRSFTYGQALVSSIALADVVARLSSGQQKVGILLPPSTAAALANVAVTLLGKVPVNLSYVVSNELVLAAIDDCNIKCVITSRLFLNKLPRLADLPGLVFLEDISSRIGTAAGARAYLNARFIPLHRLVRGDAGGNSLATVIFSSGSTGEPKGVMLSHRNILSNIDSLVSVFALRGDDNFCGVLPFFHLFGFTCALWLPIITGVSASYCPDPLDGRAIGTLARTSGSTILFATPSFLQNYIRRIERTDFARLRAVVVGAAKLDTAVADSFEARFGIRPQAGYGVTELSPVVSLNVTSEQGAAPGKFGNKENTVGLPIPGVQVQVVDVETGRLLPPGRDGLLMVKGPNVMLGYLNRPELSREVLKDGWYNTGDVASIDAEGFLRITDRLSRFSKIGGEMVPHVVIEQVYHRELDAENQVLVVTGVPEPRKGEELVVLYLEQAGPPEKLHELICNSSLPNLWKPRRDNYVKIDSIPSVGSGKVDLCALKRIAVTARKSPGAG